MAKELWQNATEKEEDEVREKIFLEFSDAQRICDVLDQKHWFIMNCQLRRHYEILHLLIFQCASQSSVLTPHTTKYTCTPYSLELIDVQYLHTSSRGMFGTRLYPFICDG